MNPIQALTKYISQKILEKQLQNHPILSPIPESEHYTSGQPKPTPTPMPQFGRVTYYLPTGGQTATGTTPQSGYSAAISRQLLGKVPMGSLIQLPDGRVVRVEDLTANDILDTLDLFYQNQSAVSYPKRGLETNVPYSIVGRDTTGMKYNYK